MNRLATTAILAALCPAMLGSVRAVAASGIVVAESEHDFGKTMVGDTVTYAFTLRNEGSKPIQVLDVRTDCPCLKTTYDKTIPPGKTAEIRISLDMTDQEGALAKTVTVTTDDATTPTVSLVVKALATPVLSMRPGYARYIYVQQEVPGRVTQTIWASDKVDFKILDVKSPYPFLTASFHEASEVERRPDGVGRQWIVETVLAPDAPVGPLAAWVEIATDHPKQKRVHLEVTGFVRPVLAVTPSKVELGSRTLEHPDVGSFRVQVFSTEEVPVTSVESDVKGLKLRLETVQPGRNYRIHFSLTPELPKGEFHGSMRVHTASPKAPLVEVPVSGRLE